jgi:TonB family protein
VLRIVVGVIAVALGAGCPGKGGRDDTAPPGYPTDFTPPPPLAEPPPPDPETPGLPYLQQIEPALAGPWAGFLEDLRLRMPPSHKLNDPALAVTLELVIEPGGRLASVRVVSPSGNPELDDVALEIARGASYPPAPAEWLSDDRRAHVRWTFARDRRQAGVAGASLDRLRFPLDRAVGALIEAGALGEAAARIAEAAGAEGADPARLAALLRAVAVAAARDGLASGDAGTAQAAIGLVVAGRMTELVAEVRRLAGAALDPALRIAAIGALGRVGNGESTALLVKLVAGGERGGAELAAAAAGALEALGKRAELAAVVTSSLGGADDDARWAALAALGQVPVDGTVPALLALVRRGGKAEQLAAAAALGPAAPSSKPAQDALVAGLASSDPAMRAAAAHALAVAAPGGAVRAAYGKVAERLKDRDERVRAAAATAAARIDPVRFGRELAVLDREKSSLVELALAEGLGPVPGAEPVIRLEKLRKSSNPLIRQAADRAMCDRREAGLRPLCAALVQSRDPAVRAAGVAALDGAALRGLLSDSQPDVRAAAVGRLAAGGGAAEIAVAAQAYADGPTGPMGLLVLAAWLEVAGPAGSR